MRRAALFMLSVVLCSASLTGCSYPQEVQTVPMENEPVREQHVVSMATYRQNLGEPFMISSIGQSTDAHMVGALLKRAGIDHAVNMTLTPAQLSSQVQTLVLVVGGGPKGLAHARATVENEIARARGLTAYARELNIPVVIMHIGGELRRGPVSDQLVSAIAAWADYLVVVSDGNRDGLFTRLAGSAKIPLETVDRLAASIEPLRRLIQKL